MFTHLHLHTEYSLLDGANRIGALARRVKDLGMDACAITDHGVMYGVIDFYRAMKKEGVKPIIGLEAYVAPRLLTDKEAGVDRDPYHLILLAENDQGYKNLCQLSSISFIDGFYYRPRIDWPTLLDHKEGLICLSACLAGETSQTFFKQGYEAAKQVALRFHHAFGPGHYFLELQDNGLPEQVEYNAALMKINQETGIPLVATNDCHYLEQEDAYAHEVLVCMQTGKRMTDPDRMSMATDAFYVKSPEEMAKAFASCPEAIENTGKIASRCQVDLDFKRYYLPEFVAPNGADSKDYLREICYEGLAQRLKSKTTEIPDQAYFDRVDKELEVINSMGYTDYFLIVWDFVAYAHKNNIMVGPGRGSGGGSVVAWALRITNIDPLKYNLLFERFLNKDRVSMPDFDLDFCYVRRPEMIDYVTRKYGADHVCQVITFGTLAARAVIRDVARALDMPYAEADRIAKSIPAQLGITIEKALELNQDLKSLYDSDPSAKTVIDLARKFEGMPRHASTHAAGVVISGEPIADVAPLARNDEAIVVQFNKDIIESVGLLKFDFLGLRTLTVIQDTIDLVGENHGVEIDPDQLADDDPAVYAMLGEGDTAGVFQLESAGMTSFIKEMKPRSLEDIIAGISLYRPGPMEQIPRYIAAQRDPSSIYYDHPSLEPILKMTYGCIIYQEQVMQIVRDLAGFSMAQSDIVRRAMSKKKPDELAKYKTLFIHGGEDDTGKHITGAVHNGIPEQVADKIFEEVMSFAGYAFNKSHAAGYAVLAYQTAWLKHYYPVEFMAAILNSFLGNLDKASNYINICRQNQIRVLPPDINKSQVKFSVEEQAIRFALGAVKNVGEGAVTQVIEERNKAGEFTSFGDFIKRMADYRINKKVIESLIKASAMDVFGIDRVKLLAVHDSYAQQVNQSKSMSMAGQVSLFEMGDGQAMEIPEPDYPDLTEFSDEEKLAQEKEFLGLYVTGHPLDQYESAINLLTTCRAGDLQVDQQVEDSDGLGESLTLSGDNRSKLHDRQQVIMAGMIRGVRDFYTKRQEKMAFVSIEDLTGPYEIIVFPKAYPDIAPYLQESRVVIVQGRLSVREDEETKLIAESMRDLSPETSTLPSDFAPLRREKHVPEAQSPAGGQVRKQAQDQPSPARSVGSKLTLCLKWPSSLEGRDSLALRQMLSFFDGPTVVVVYEEQTGQTVRLDQGFDLQYLPYLSDRYGQDNIVLI